MAPAALHVIASRQPCVCGQFCQVSSRVDAHRPNFAREVVLSPSAHRVVRWSLSLGVLLDGPIL